MFNDSRHLYEFENFRLDAENQSLWCEGKLVSIPPKVLETLILLIKRNGEIVSRDELLEKVWKETFVEEGNINYTISQLRKILGEKNLIQTIPKHGYRFIGKIEIVSTNSNSNKVESQILVETETPKPIVNKPQSKFRWAIFAAFLLGIFQLGVLRYLGITHKNFPFSKPFIIINSMAATSFLKSTAKAPSGPKAMIGLLMPIFLLYSSENESLKYTN